MLPLQPFKALKFNQSKRGYAETITHRTTQKRSHFWSVLYFNFRPWKTEGYVTAELVWEETKVSELTKNQLTADQQAGTIASLIIGTIPLMFSCTLNGD